MPKIFVWEPYTQKIPRGVDIIDSTEKFNLKVLTFLSHVDSKRSTLIATHSTNYLSKIGIKFRSHSAPTIPSWGVHRGLPLIRPFSSFWLQNCCCNSPSNHIYQIYLFAYDNPQTTGLNRQQPNWQKVVKSLIAIRYALLGWHKIIHNLLSSVNW